MRKIAFFVMLALILGTVIFTSCDSPAVTAAKVYFDQKDYDAAIEQAKKALETNPNDPSAWYVMGEAYKEKRMYNEMNDAYNKSLEAGPKHAEEIQNDRNSGWTSTLNKGVALYQQDKMSEASEQFLTCTKILPEKSLAYKYLGWCFRQLGEFNKAVQAFEKAYELDPTDFESLFQVGNTYYDLKEFETCIEKFRFFIDKAGTQNQFYPDALYLIAICYDILGKPEEAIAAYEDALTSDPNNVDLKFNMGRLYIRKENWENALEMFSAVLEAKPNDAEASLAVGQCYLGLKKYPDAIRYLEKATQLAPNNPDAWWWLGTGTNGRPRSVLT